MCSCRSNLFEGWRVNVSIQVFTFSLGKQVTEGCQLLLLNLWPVLLVVFLIYLQQSFHSFPDGLFIIVFSDQFLKAESHRVISVLSHFISFTLKHA